MVRWKKKKMEGEKGIRRRKEEKGDGGKEEERRGGRWEKKGSFRPLASMRTRSLFRENGSFSSH